ncbi:MAG: ABC transporter substrate-binding protein [Actinomycetota bacterium]
MLERLGRLLSDARWAKGLAVGIAVVLVTAIASLGQVSHQRNQDEQAAISATGEPSEQPGLFDQATAAPTDGSAAPTDGSATPGQSVTPGGKTASPKTSNSPKVAIPDFGLKTQGVTDKEVKIGVTYNISGCGDAGTLQTAFSGVSGDVKKSVDTYVKYVNEKGGIGGRTLKWVAADDGGGGCEEKAGAAAVQLAEEDKVFLAVPGLHTVSDAIVARKIPVFGGRDDPASLARYGPNGIMLTEPIEPTLDIWASFGKYYIDTPKHPACLIHVNDPTWNTAEKIVVDKMKKYGMTFRDIISYQDDVATAQTQANTAAARAKAKGCEQAWFMANNPIAMVFFTQAATQNAWYPTWTWTSYVVLADSELAGRLMDQSQWKNAIGLSTRVPAGQHPKEGNCQRIYEQYNGNDGQSTSAAAQIACAQVLSVAEIMNRAISRTGVLTANSLLMGADSVKNNFYWDAHVPITWSFPGPQGPFKTKGYSHYTVAKWNTSTSAYDFPEFPKYWKVMGPDKSGAEDLRPLFKLG